MVNIDPAKMRALAQEVRGNATTMQGVTPIAVPSRDDARTHAKQSSLAVKIEESLKAMDSVVQYHVRRLNEFSGELDRQAAEYEATDQNNAQNLHQAGPR